MGKTNPLVSVVIPCYNYGNYLEEAIDSCIRSTYKNIEIIVVNDGSKDPLTVKVLTRLNKPDTVIIHQNNKGSSAARNRGIAEGRGKYILPLDADDKIESTYIEEAVEVLEEKPEIGFVTCWYQCFGDLDRIVKVPPFDITTLVMKNIVCVCSLFRKEAWEQAGGYNEKMMGYEDWDFWISLAERGWSGYLIPKILYYYRKHSGSKFLKSRKNHQNLVKQIRENHPVLYADKV